MIRAILWKEWHEHRTKYLSYWVTVNAPLILFALAIGLFGPARVPFADLSDANVMKYLPLTLIQTLLVVTLFLVFTGYLAVATFSPEIDDRSLFFIFEQPISRKRYLAIKFLNGACHVLLATSCAILLFPVVAYAMMLLSGKVTMAGSSAACTLVMAAAARTALWCALISLSGFAASALVSALVPRWWLAAVCSVAVTLLMIQVGSEYYSFFPDTSEEMSVGMSVSTGNAQWVTISRAVTRAEINAFGHWRPWPLLAAALLVALFYLGTMAIYERKELK